MKGLREFLIKKAPIMMEHSQHEKDLVRRTAARDFDRPPGHFFEDMLLLELMTKFRLDTANMEVLQAAVQHELKMRGLEFEADFIQERTAFEIRKAGILNALNEEIAHMRQARAWDSHQLDMAMLDLAFREIVLAYVEVAIKREIESLRQQELEEEQRLHPYMEESAGKRTELADARLELAQERLKILAPVRLLIEKQGEILAHERDVILPKTEELIVVKGDLIAVQTNELLPAMEALAATIEQWATERPFVVQKILEKAQHDWNLADREMALTVYMILAANARLAAAESSFEMLSERTELAVAQINRAVNMKEQSEKEILLARAELAFAQKQAERLDPLRRKIGVLDTFSAKQSEVVVALLQEAQDRLEIAETRKLAATFRIASMLREIETLEHEIDVEEARNSIESIRTKLDIERRKTEADRADASNKGMGSLIALRNSLVAQREAIMGGVHVAREARVEHEIAERLDGAKTSTGIKYNAMREYHEREGDNEYKRMTKIADINARTEVSAELIHLVG